LDAGEAVTLMGLIAPVTLVGALVFHCVDVLTGITMAQIIRPGAPVLFGGAPATFHMKAASAPMAAIEAQHLNVAYVAIAKYLGLPTPRAVAKAFPAHCWRPSPGSTRCPGPGCSISC